MTGPVAADTEERPGIIEAVPVRHPWRYVAIAVIVVLLLMFLHMVLTNPAFNWPFVFEAMNQSLVIEGFIKGTLLCTVLAMFHGAQSPCHAPKPKSTSGQRSTRRLAASASTRPSA